MSAEYCLGFHRKISWGGSHRPSGWLLCISSESFMDISSTGRLSTHSGTIPWKTPSATSLVSRILGSWCCKVSLCEFKSIIGIYYNLGYFWLSHSPVGSLAYQTLHLNKYWRFVIETWVTVHAGVVAYQTVPNIMGKELWPMFLFGFATVIILTQVGKTALSCSLPLSSAVTLNSYFTVISSMVSRSGKICPRGHVPYHLLSTS